RAAESAMPARALSCSRTASPSRHIRSNSASETLPGVRTISDILSSEDSGMQRIEADPVGKLGRMFDVPDSQVGARTRRDHAPIGKAERTGRVIGHARKAFGRSQAKERGAHIHGQKKRSQRRG